jgi:hypothetical protein
MGFAPIDVEGLQIQAVEAGLLGQALTSGRQDYSGGLGSALPVLASGDETRDAVAVPLEVAGSVIAVLYADAPRSDNSEGLPWTDAVDVMARWAGRLLEAITVRDAATMWGPRPIAAYRVASSMRSE